MTPYGQVRANLVGRALETLARLWLSLGTWHEPDVARFQSAALPVLQGAQRALGQLAAAQVGRLASMHRGRPVAPLVVSDGLLVAVRDGVTVADEYRRPFEQLWYGLSTGEDLPAAVDRGKVRLLGLADLDLQVTEVKAARSAMEQTGATWWRRVPQGEKTCLLCLVASTQAYRVENLKAVHGGCDCTIEAQYTPRPRDRVVDPETLTAAYAAVKEATGAVSTNADTLRGLLADMTQHHSEVGPILAYPKGVKRPS